ncbi:MAG: hypothetical protein AAF581_00750 [Planctomycetota bacterium]
MFRPLLIPFATAIVACCAVPAVATASTEKPVLSLEVSRPRMLATVANLNSGEFEIQVRIKNNSEKPQLVSPYLRLEVQDSDGNTVKPSRKLGRFGRRPRGCPLPKLKFDTVAPGESVTRKVKLSRYMTDPDYILAWKLAAAGIYKLVFSYDYDPSQLLPRCKEDCESHGNPESTWNRAWVGRAAKTLELRVHQK